MAVLGSRPHEVPGGVIRASLRLPAPAPRTTARWQFGNLSSPTAVPVATRASLGFSRLVRVVVAADQRIDEWPQRIDAFARTATSPKVSRQIVCRSCREELGALSCCDRKCLSKTSQRFVRPASTFAKSSPESDQFGLGHALLALLLSTFANRDPFGGAVDMSCSNRPSAARAAYSEQWNMPPAEDQIA